MDNLLAGLLPATDLTVDQYTSIVTALLAFEGTTIRNVPKYLNKLELETTELVIKNLKKTLVPIYYKSRNCKMDS